MNEPKTEVVFQNAVVVRKYQSGVWHISVSDQVLAVKDTYQEVVEWIEFNWPAGTKVSWRVMSW